MAENDTTRSATSRAGGKPAAGSVIIPLLVLALVGLLFLRALEPSEETGRASGWSFAWTEQLSWEWSGSWIWHQLQLTLNDIPIFLKAQGTSLWKLLLWSLIPAFVGLIYRRSFWRWFALGFLALYAIDVLAPFIPGGTFRSLHAQRIDGLGRSYSYYVVLEVLLVVVFLGFRLYWRRYRLFDLPVFLARALPALAQILWWFLLLPRGKPLLALLLFPVKLLALLLGVPVLVVWLAFRAGRWIVSRFRKARVPEQLATMLRGEPELEAAWNALGDATRAAHSQAIRDAVESLNDAESEADMVGGASAFLEALDETLSMLRLLRGEPELEAAWNALSAAGREKNVQAIKDAVKAIEHAKTYPQETSAKLALEKLLAKTRGVLRNTAAERPRKNIVVCLDGTWNEPGQLDFGRLAETNVLKLFKLMKQDGHARETHYNASLERTYSGKGVLWEDETGAALDHPAAALEAALKTKTEATVSERASALAEGTAAGAMKAASGVLGAALRRPKQLAFYYRGVGNKAEYNPLAQKFGGAFGLGAAGIVDRAYLDVARVYRPGDRVFIFGFSRGAAIARLLAGVLGRRGVPKHIWTLRLLGRNFTVWKSSTRLDRHDPIKVEVLGCWDTVGAFGISKNVLGIPFQKIDLLKDLTVASCVKRAYHMVALDETRDAFVPTLMDPDPTDPQRIVEVWFAGNHANVGGGYATDKLSDLTLGFLLEHVSSGYSSDRSSTPGDERWGLYLEARRIPPEVVRQSPNEIQPDERGKIRHSTGPIYKHEPRKLPLHALVHESAFDRMKDGESQYAPRSLFNLNRRLLELRYEIETGLMQCRVGSRRRQPRGAPPPADAEGLQSWLLRHGTGTLDPKQFKLAMRWAKKLRVRKWRKEKPPLGLEPWKELRNPNAPLIEFEIEDQRGTPHRSSDYLGEFLWVLGADAGWSEFPEVMDARTSRLAAFKVADLSDYTEVPKSVSSTGKPVLMDWKGRFAKAYGWERDSLNVLIFAPDGRLVYQVHGQLAERFMSREQSARRERIYDALQKGWVLPPQYRK